MIQKILSWGKKVMKENQVSATSVLELEEADVSRFRLITDGLMLRLYFLVRLEE